MEFVELLLPDRRLSPIPLNPTAEYVNQHIEIIERVKSERSLTEAQKDELYDYKNRLLISHQVGQQVNAQITNEIAAGVARRIGERLDQLQRTLQTSNDQFRVELTAIGRKQTEIINKQTELLDNFIEMQEGMVELEVCVLEMENSRFLSRNHRDSIIFPFVSIPENSNYKRQYRTDSVTVAQIAAMTGAECNAIIQFYSGQINVTNNGAGLSVEEKKEAIRIFVGAYRSNQ